MKSRLLLVSKLEMTSLVLVVTAREATSTH
jgi:hypothetical protein